MKKLLYYCMLFLFFVCVVWNALSKRDSIMGIPAQTTDREQPIVSEVLVATLP